MPPLGWNEIKARAIAFAKEWEGEASLPDLGQSKGNKDGYSIRTSET